MRKKDAKPVVTLIISAVVSITEKLTYTTSIRNIKFFFLTTTIEEMLYGYAYTKMKTSGQLNTTRKLKVKMIYWGKSLTMYKSSHKLLNT